MISITVVVLTMVGAAAAAAVTAVIAAAIVADFSDAASVILGLPWRMIATLCVVTPSDADIQLVEIYVINTLYMSHADEINEGQDLFLSILYRLLFIIYQLSAKQVVGGVVVEKIKCLENRVQ